MANDLILNLYKGETLEYDEKETYIDLFLKQVRCGRERKAISDCVSSITYGELDAASDAVAARLLSMGVGKGDIVPICLPRRKEYVVALTGVLKSGAAFVPLEPEYPEERKAYISKEVSAKVIIDSDWMSGEMPPSAPINYATADSVAYLIFTSGTTGRPKGVVITHSAVRAGFFGFDVDERSVGAQVSNFSFIVGTHELMYGVAFGAHHHIIDGEMRKDMAELCRYVRENEINTLISSPMLAKILVDKMGMRFKHLVTGADKYVPLTNIEEGTVANMFGCSECMPPCIACKDIKPGEMATLGRPAPNMYAFVCSEDGELVGKGEVGELYLCGPQVAAGYFNMPEKSAAAFMDCPFLPGKKMFRTGDLVRYDEDGNLEYVGRKDFMIKVRGYRIEPEEIENVAINCPGITAVAAASRLVNGEAQVVLFYVSEPEMDEGKLKSHLGTYLADYMMPDIYRRVVLIPRNANGKIDRKNLPKIELNLERAVRPANELEGKIYGAVRELIDAETFGVTDDFISLGMTSIMAIQLSSLLWERVGIQINVRNIMLAPTVRGLAELAQRDIDKSRYRHPYPMQQSYPMPDNNIVMSRDWMDYPNAAHMNIPCYLKVEDVDVERLRTAIISAINAHPSMKMRAAIENSRFLMVRNDGGEVEIPIFRLDEEPDKEFFQTMIRPFDIIHEAQYRVKLYTWEKSVYVFGDICHLVADGVSLGILWNDVDRFYKGETVGQETYTFFDRALELREIEQSDEATRQDRYFEQLNGNMRAFTRIPYSRKPEARSIKDSGRELSVRMHNGLINKLCRAHGVTLSNFFLAATMAGVKKLTGEKDVVIVNYGQARSEPYLSDTVGMMLSGFPVYFREEDSECSRIGMVKRIQGQILETMTYDTYQHLRLVKKYAVKFFEVSYLYQGGVLDVPRYLDGKEVELTLLRLPSVIEPLLVEVIPHGEEEYEVKIIYNATLYNAPDVKHIAEVIIDAAAGIAENPRAR